MHGIQIEFEWTRFADYGVHVKPGTPGTVISEASTKYVIALGAPEAALTTKPLEFAAELYLELAQASSTTQGHVEFARKHGLLIDQSKDSADQWPKAIERINHLIELTRSKEKWPIRDGKYEPLDIEKSFSLRMRASSNSSGVSLSIVPRNLYVALALQCVLHSSAGAQVRPCRACGKLFEIGGSSGNRSHKGFCSSKCRFDFNHRKRRKA